MIAERKEVMSMKILEILRANRRVILLLGILILLVPLFGYASEVVGYSEPMENLAESFEVSENTLYHGLFYDYSIDGLDPYLGALLCGIIGILVTLLIVNVILRLITIKKNESS